MVVTIIAILALLIIPLFRDRVEAARRAAAQDELKSLQTAEMLAFADTGWFYRLQDLDNSTQFNEPPVFVHQEIPIARWNRPFTPEERRKLTEGDTRWKGPYISVTRYKAMEMSDAIITFPEFFWSQPGQGGPIMDILSPNGADWWPGANVPIAGDDPDDFIIIDPWGTPYLFFGTGQMNELEGSYNESDFGNAALYCLGPDGMPGDQVPYVGDGSVLMRELGIVGTGDDYWIFM
jgi:type II secretory pathway pseudopilin PulG